MKNLRFLPVLGTMGLLALAGCSGSNNNNNPVGATFQQQDRLARPIVNEALATYANNRHRVNNLNSPPEDGNEAGDPNSGDLATPMREASSRANS